ncbi:MAG: hypothetical protein KIT35_21950 [Piscinibacter sp.]|uniref:hypothetical protein n=1 Tax=Piscinibacter sp. TaxID=1903157 RepID=UPI00258281DE|nr:hypothetical protein [Piscinibacter sp.]MCW5666504.1 hypothetical protein [Piscinibacter sp.]
MSDLSLQGNDDGLDSVTQSRVPATGAPPVATTAPNSVFAMGAAAKSGEPTGDQAGEQAPDLADLEAQTLELLTKGDLSTRRISDALGVGIATVKTLTTRLQKGRKVWRIGKGPATRFSLAKGGFQGWLARQGAPAALGKAAPAKAAAKAQKALPAKRPAKAPARAVAPAAPAPAAPLPVAPSTITCGLFSDGRIQIETPDDSMTLDRDQARALIAWLFKVDTVMREVKA